MTHFPLFESLEPRTLLAATPVVSIIASDPAANENVQAGSLTGDPGEFTISRDVITDKALTVKLTIGGTATSGKDYTRITKSVKIPANAASVTITIAPFDDGKTEGQETVVLSVVANAAYTVSLIEATATVTIADATYLADDFWPMVDGHRVYWIGKDGRDAIQGWWDFTDNGNSQFACMTHSTGDGWMAGGGLLLQSMPDGIYRIADLNDDGSRRRDYDTSLLFLPNPLAIGSVRTSTSTYPDGTRTETITVLGVETVTVPEGTFRTVKVKMVTDSVEADWSCHIEETFWLARGAGMVKMIQKGKEFNAAHKATGGSNVSIGSTSRTPMPCGWVAGTPMTAARMWLGGGVIDGKVYAFGGEEADWPNNPLYEYDPIAQSWAVKASNTLVGGCGDCTTAVMDGKLYVIACEGPYEWNGGVTINSVFVYDPSSDTWAQTPNSAKPTPVSSGPWAVYNGEIYVFGGEYWSGVQRRDALVDAVEAYNPTTNVWRSVTKMPKKLFGASVGVVGDNAYVTGGVGTNLKGQTKTMAFGFTTGKWRTSGLADIPRMHLNPGDGGAAPVIDGKVYVIGGGVAKSSVLSGPGWTTNLVDIYDPATNTWTAGPSLPKPLFYALSVVGDNSLYVIGGTTLMFPNDDGGRVADVWVLPLT